MKTDYQKQATDFLAKFNIKFRATLSDTKTPQWGDNAKHGHHFRVTLSKGERGQGVKFGRRVTFDFWSSIADLEAGIETVDAYSVLSCISGDVNCPDTFKDFCGEYGYGEDSIQALQTFRRCASFGRRLRAFFTEQEIAELEEIR